ncbi:MAG: 16S rRNA (uracil(1498)-N(3))-methyltransferase [Lachnospiraceae bacterium]|nr:16S rRNA (uracil(1498)-N(3))-methyltransferase [Lachnospiraceae bacterium]
MYRFFVDPSQIGEKEIRITGSDVNHIKNVLRMKEKEEVIISDGQKMEYTCYLKELNPDEIVASIMFADEVGLELPSKVYLFQGLPKSDKMELIIQKAVELGAYEIIPVSTKRTIVKLDAKKEAAKLKRWQGISESAAKQSKRMVIPQVTKVMSFKEALEYARDMDVKLIPYELAKDMAETKGIIEQIKPGQSIGIFIGPEGGFEESEVSQALEMDFHPITLGKRILRTETAGFTVLSILMYQLEQ